MGKESVAACVHVHRHVGPPPPSTKAATGPHLSRVRWRFALSGLGKSYRIGVNAGDARSLPWAGLGCTCGQVLHLNVLTASCHSCIFFLVAGIVEAAVCLPLEAP